MFSGEELLAFVDQASYVAVNDYEGRMLEERTGRKLEDMAQELKALVLTRAQRGLSSTRTANGSRFLASGQSRWWIPPVAAMRIAPVFFMVLQRASTGRRPAGSLP